MWADLVDKALRARCSGEFGDERGGRADDGRAPHRRGQRAQRTQRVGTNLLLGSRLASAHHLHEQADITIPKGGRDGIRQAWNEMWKPESEYLAPRDVFEVASKAWLWWLYFLAYLR